MQKTGNGKQDDCFMSGVMLIKLNSHRLFIDIFGSNKSQNARLPLVLAKLIFVTPKLNFVGLQQRANWFSLVGSMMS